MPDKKRHPLSEFAHRFFGYGHLDAPIWFIGMEEGGGDCRSEIIARIRTWKQLGRTPTVDIRRLGEGAGLRGHRQWFEGDRPPLQSTWSKLIRTVLAYRGDELTTETVRHYQRDSFAAEDGDECLMELLPLPSPGTDEWHYGEWFELLWLENRKRYREYVLDHRIERLQEMFREHQPEAVVFYSRKYFAEWCRIVGCDREAFDVRDLCESEGKELPAAFFDDGATAFVVSYHPVAYGVTNRYFERIGMALR